MSLGLGLSCFKWVFKTNWELNFIHPGRTGQIKHLMWLNYGVLLVGGDIFTFIMLYFFYFKLLFYLYSIQLSKKYIRWLGEVLWSCHCGFLPKSRLVLWNTRWGQRPTQSMRRVDWDCFKKLSEWAWNINPGCSETSVVSSERGSDNY